MRSRKLKCILKYFKQRAITFYCHCLSTTNIFVSLSTNYFSAITIVWSNCKFFKVGSKFHFNLKKAKMFYFYSHLRCKYTFFHKHSSKNLTYIKEFLFSKLTLVRILYFTKNSIKNVRHQYFPNKLRHIKSFIIHF